MVIEFGKIRNISKEKTSQVRLRRKDDEQTKMKSVVIKGMCQREREKETFRTV